MYMILENNYDISLAFSATSKAYWRRERLYYIFLDVINDISSAELYARRQFRYACCSMSRIDTWPWMLIDVGNSEMPIPSGRLAEFPLNVCLCSIIEAHSKVNAIIHSYGCLYRSIG